MPLKKQHDARPALLKQENESPAKAGPSLVAHKTALTNYAEAQQDELDALKSIYMDDFEEVKGKAAAWNVSNSKSFISKA